MFRCLRPLTHAPEIVVINSVPDSGAIFRADERPLTSLTAFGSQRQTMIEVVHPHEKLVPESGIEFRPMAPISGACVTGLRERLSVAAVGALHSVVTAVNHVHFEVISHKSVFCCFSI